MNEIDFSGYIPHLIMILKIFEKQNSDLSKSFFRIENHSLFKG